MQRKGTPSRTGQRLAGTGSPGQNPANRVIQIDSRAQRDGARRLSAQILPFRQSNRRTTILNQAQPAIRVLFLSPHYPPDVAATGQLVAELAEDLVSAGQEAVVLAARPASNGKSTRPYRLLEREVRNGVEIHWLGVPSAGRRGLWS
ncbi:MAG: hypothetical protein HKM98_08125, partial [Gammaproteobacteria bacterium]|nr:hypothetical protein [Gammaproteobacteria bacterium]